MLSLRYVILVRSIVNARLPSPFDIRIDHQKVDTTRDLVINTPRPNSSFIPGQSLRIPTRLCQDPDLTGSCHV